MSTQPPLNFVIYTYFPYGGQQRDFMRVLRECLVRGYAVNVYTMQWTGEVPSGVTLHLAPVKAMTKTRLYRQFTRWLQAELATAERGLVVGFNKMPGLDVYYAADPCFEEMAASQRAAYYRFTPRYRHFAAYEAAVLSGDTQVLYLSPQQRAAFSRYYPGCEPRLHELPPGLADDRRLADASPAARAQRKAAVRERLQHELNIAPDATLILQVGSGFKVKGVDRALRAVASYSGQKQLHYLLVGSGKPAAFIRLAKRLGIAEKVTIVGGRDDVPDLLAAADLMLHPAYRESAGYTLLEAVVAGLPVLTTATCGYAFHVILADAGRVCDEPFVQSELNAALAQMLAELPKAQWSANGLAYGADERLYSMPQAAVDVIERVIARKHDSRA